MKRCGTTAIARSTLRFVSNVDPTDFAEATRDLDPATHALHRRLEDVHDARDDDQRARRPGLVPARFRGLRDERAIAKHFVAVSTQRRPRWRASGSTPPTGSSSGTGSGGRYSLASAIGLSTLLAIGPQHFRALPGRISPAGRALSDAPFEQNLPVLMGLLGVWYADFFGAQTHAVLPYDQYLKRFPAYLQQLVMESNGKRVTLGGAPRRLRDQPGRLGRARKQRAAFLLPAAPPGHAARPLRFHRLRAVAEPARGAARSAARERAGPERGARFRQDRAGRPPPQLRGQSPELVRCWRSASRPETLGKLIALYEHSVFTQAAIWDIDAFDQWGVELGKQLASRIVPGADGGATSPRSRTTAPPTR